MAKTSPTKRTLKVLRDAGWTVAVAEHWQAIPGHPGGGVRKDLFGFIDIVCLSRGRIVGIQCTSTAWQARVSKIKNECRDNAIAWLNSGGLIEVWGWRKLKKKVDRKTWQPVIVAITLDDF